MPDSLARKIDYLFYHEDEIRRKIRDARRDRPRGSLLVKPCGKSVSNPTLSQVISKLMPLRFVAMDDGKLLRNPESCLKAIESTYSQSTPQESNIAKMKYRGISSQEIIARLDISLWQFYRVMNRFRRLGILFGKKFFIF